jgi:ligand-binding sensor domain-containing protein
MSVELMEDNRMIRRASILTVLLTCVVGSAATNSAHAGQPEWRVVKPSNTGIPGEEVRFVRFAPDGRPWVAARWPFWQEGGVGILDRETGRWTTHANWETALPSEYVNDIEFGSGGVIWIATGNGLLKIDGDDWTVYNTSNAPLVHNVITSIDQDADGHVWINNSGVQTTDAAIFEFDGANWTKFSVGAELPWPLPWKQLADVIVGSDGHVWVSNKTLNGVAEYDGVSWQLHGSSVGRFGELMEDLDGNIWIRAGVGGGNSFWKFDGIQFTHFPIGTTPTCLGLGPDGAVYTGDWFGNVRKTTNGGQSWTFFLTGLNQVFDITPDPQGTDVWIGTIGAVGHFDGNGTWVRDYNSYNTGMPWYWIDRMTTDNDGNFWFATGEAGLSRRDDTLWRNWGAHNAGSEEYPFAGNEPMGTAYQDTNGMVWMGGNGITRWDPLADEFLGFWNWQNNPGMGVTLFIYFAEDAAGNLFAADKYGNIMRFNGTMWVAEPVSVYSGGNLPGMQTDSQGNVWVQGWFAIHRWNGKIWEEFDTNPPLFDLGGANALAIGLDDTLWIGTNEGLVHYDAGITTVYNTGNSPLPAQEVQGVSIRSDGLIGLSAIEFGAQTPFPNGVAVIDGDINDDASWSVYHYEDSPLPHYQLGEVAFDAQGNLWVSALSEGAAVLEFCETLGDLNGDCAVGADDLAILLGNWGPCGDCADCPADLDGDCTVGAADLAILLGNWG